MEDLEEYLTKMKSIQQESIQRIETLESQKDQLQGNVVIKEKEKEEVRRFGASEHQSLEKDKYFVFYQHIYPACRRIFTVVYVCVSVQLFMFLVI